MANMWDTYGVYIIRRRVAGATLAEIGGDLGISKQRVGQMLAEHCGATDLTTLFTARRVASMVGLSVDRINAYRRAGLIAPANASRARPLYGPDAVEGALTRRRCQTCGELVPTGRVASCSPECQTEANRQAHARASWRRLRRKVGLPITSSVAYKKRLRDECGSLWEEK